MKQEEVEDMADSDFELEEALNEINSGIVMRIINGIFTEEYTLQAEFTGKLIEIKTQYGKINIKNEMDNHATLVGIILENLEDENKLIDEIAENQDDIIVAELSDLTNENDISFEWGKYILNNVYKLTGERPDLFVYGNDESRQGWFSEDDKSGIDEMILSRDIIKISATNLRGLVLIDKKEERKTWRKN